MPQPNAQAYANAAPQAAFQRDPNALRPPSRAFNPALHQALGVTYPRY
jgi:hypothetical protein